MNVAFDRARPMAHVRYALSWIILDAVQTTPQNGVWVEIGAGVGTGLAAMARVLIDAGRDDVTLISVDPFAGTARCGEQTRPEHNRMASRHGDWQLFVSMMSLHAPVEFGRVHMWRMTSLQAARAMDSLVDLVIIDGDHALEAVRADIAVWDPLVRQPGGTIGFDDMVAGSEVEEAVLERYPDCERRGNPFSTGFQVDWPTARVRY